MLAIFFAIGQTFGGVIAPTLFGFMVAEGNRFNVFVLYCIGNKYLYNALPA